MNNHQTLRKSAKFLAAIGGGLLMSLSVIPQEAVAQRLQQPQPTPNSKVNPCPGIFYEEPHNNRVLVPQSCPPNALTRRLAEQRGLPVGNNPTSEQIRMGVGGDLPENRSENVESYNYSRQRQSTMTQSGQNMNNSSLNSQGYRINGTAGGYTQRRLSQQNQNNNIRTIPAPEQRQSPIAYVSPANGLVSVKLRNDTQAPITYEAIGYTGQRVLQGGQEVVLQNLSVPVTITTIRQDNGFLKVMPMSTQSGMIEFSLDEQQNVDNNQGAIRIQQDGQVFLN